MNDEFKVTSNYHVSCRADNALAARCQSFAARCACVLKRPIFYLAAYIDNNFLLIYDLYATLAKSSPLDFPSEKSFLLFFAHEKGLGHMFRGLLTS